MRRVLCSLLLAGCGTAHYVAGELPADEPDVTDLEDPSPPSATDADPDPTVPTPWVNGDPSEPPPYDGPPPDWLGTDCAAIGVSAEIDDLVLRVESYDGPQEVTFLSFVAGWYDLYDLPLADSGDRERNESAMVRVSNDTAPDGTPVVTNCDDDWVTVDRDNDFDPGDVLTYLGTFWFDVGANRMEIRHLCPTVRAGSCAGLESTVDPRTTCAANDDNEVSVDGGSFCMVAPR